MSEMMQFKTIKNARKFAAQIIVNSYSFAISMTNFMAYLIMITFFSLVDWAQSYCSSRKMGLYMACLSFLV